MVKKKSAPIRDLLRSKPDGMTTQEIGDAIGMDRDGARRALLLMPDAYIDRWITVPSGYSAVWAVVVPPANCPHPAKDSQGDATT